MADSDVIRGGVNTTRQSPLHLPVKSWCWFAIYALVHECRSSTAEPRQRSTPSRADVDSKQQLPDLLASFTPYHKMVA